MRAGWVGQSLNIVAGTLFVLAATQGTADARNRHSTQLSRTSTALHSGFNQAYATRTGRSWRPSFRRSGLQCVPFARENSGIELSGNAGTWWNNASGLYERGARPEVGSILNFRATGHMRMGHVAVVTNVISSRHIEIDHANWGAPGRISRNIDVVDVSANNDWTAVRVALNQAEDYGSTYPTYGFIYDRPDQGTMVANNSALPASSLKTEARLALPVANAPEEVAEAADDDEGPRYSSRRRSVHGTRSTALHASASRSRHGSGFAAATYRVSARSTGTGTSAIKPHKQTRRHF